MMRDVYQKNSISLKPKSKVSPTPLQEKLTRDNFPTMYILEPNLIDSKAINNNLLLSNEYGKDETRQQLANVLKQCGAPMVKTIPVTLDTFTKDIAGILESLKSREYLSVLNLCDGTETDGYPGLQVVKLLEEHNLPFTGANSDFFYNTTSKPTLKRLLQKKQVPTSNFVEIRSGFEKEDLLIAEKEIGYPMIVKPSVSYASLTISDKSVVKNLEDAIKQVKLVHTLTSEGVFVEEFLPGCEYTVLCRGDSELGVHVYTVAERVFSPKLKVDQRLLAFDRYWDGYDLNGGKPASDSDQLYWYAPAREEFQQRLTEIAKDAYLACGGSGYGRVDIRTRTRDSCDGLVLEVNANCGLSFGAGSSSLGEILEMSKVSPQTFLTELITYSFNRQKKSPSSKIS